MQHPLKGLWRVYYQWSKIRESLLWELKDCNFNSSSKTSLVESSSSVTSEVLRVSIISTIHRSFNDSYKNWAKKRDKITDYLTCHGNGSILSTSLSGTRTQDTVYCVTGHRLWTAESEENRTPAVIWHFLCVHGEWCSEETLPPSSFLLTGYHRKNLFGKKLQEKNLNLVCWLFTEIHLYQ